MTVMPRLGGVWEVVAVLMLTACGARSSSPQPTVSALLAEVRDAAKVRDLRRLEGLRSRARAPIVLAELSRAIYITAGLSSAKDLLVAACRDVRLAPESEGRSRACATVAFDELARGRRLNHVVSTGESKLLGNQQLLLTMVSVNGLPPEPFIVDTGAPTSILSRRYADRNKLPYRSDIAEQSSDSAGTVVRLHPVLLDSLRLGEIEIENVPAHVLDLPESFRIGGILSPQDALRDTAFEIDGPAHALRIQASQPSDVPADSVELLWNGGNMLVASRANDLPPRPFLLDSGAGANGLCEDTARDLGIANDDGTRGKSATAGGATAVRTGILGTLAVAAEPAQPSSYFVKACPRDPSNSVEKYGYVGAPWFWARHVFIPADRKRAFFTRPGELRTPSGSATP